MGVLFVDETNLWESLGEDDDIDTVMEKGQGSVNSWDSNLLTVGGELRPDKCSYTIHKMKPTKNGEWECAKATPDKPAAKGANNVDKLNDLWKDMDADKLEELEPPRPQLKIPLANGNTAVIRKLSNDDAEENLGMKVQPDSCNNSHLTTLKEKIEAWTSKVDGSQLSARAVWQSYTHQLWSSMKYGLGACSALLEEPENGLFTTDFYLTSRLGVVTNIPKRLRYLPHQYCDMELLNLSIETTATQVNCLL